MHRGLEKVLSINQLNGVKYCLGKVNKEWVVAKYAHELFSYCDYGGKHHYATFDKFTELYILPYSLV